MRKIYRIRHTYFELSILLLVTIFHFQVSSQYIIPQYEIENQTLLWVYVVDLDSRIIGLLIMTCVVLTGASFLHQCIFKTRLAYKKQMAIESMSKKQDSEIIEAAQECAICLISYSLDSELKVCQLKCHPTHVYHTDCLIEHISNGRNSCPMCRQPIE